MKRIGILLSDGVHELEFIGPLHVFGTAAQLGAACAVSLISDCSPVTCRLGTRVHVPERIESAPPQDVLFVPRAIDARYLRVPHGEVVRISGGAAAIDVALIWVERFWGVQIARAVARAVERRPSLQSPPVGVRGLV